MEAVYAVTFGVLAALAAVFELTKPKEGQQSTSQDFLRFRFNYVVVYSLMMAGDWLQGPYVYALYQHYGFDRGAIGSLFIAGFGSSMVFGTLVGSLADKTGRKKAALLYVVTYTLGCFTKHWNNYHMLMVGRLFCGVATSLLYSAFETWLVAEHFKRGFDASWLGGTFSKAVFMGNGLMAIVAGLAAQFLVDTLALGPVAPFDAAAVVMVLGGVVVLASWPENYGDASNKHTLAEQLANGARAIYNDQKIALLGAMQSLFEGSMYTFVFLWTPALSPRGESIPHGMIFACFMVASMSGSAFSSHLLTADSKCALFWGAVCFWPALGVVQLMVQLSCFQLEHRVERYMQAVFAGSAAMLFVPVLFHGQAPSAVGTVPAGTGISMAGKIQLAAFCGFEFAVGVFWPSMMKMRSQHVPEEMRATIINFFRIPLNMFVCVVLYNVSSFPLSAMFGMCSLFLVLASICQRRLDVLTRKERVTQSDAQEASTLLSASTAADADKALTSV